MEKKRGNPLGERRRNYWSVHVDRCFSVWKLLHVGKFRWISSCCCLLAFLCFIICVFRSWFSLSVWRWLIYFRLCCSSHSLLVYYFEIIFYSLPPNNEIDSLSLSQVFSLSHDDGNNPPGLRTCSFPAAIASSIQWSFSAQQRLFLLGHSSRR